MLKTQLKKKAEEVKHMLPKYPKYPEEKKRKEMGIVRRGIESLSRKQWQ